MKMFSIHKLLRHALVVFLSVFIFINQASSQLSVTATATPNQVCEGGTVQLEALVQGGSDNLSFAWVSNPTSFVPDVQNPVVSPSVTTVYTVSVTDLDIMSSATDQVTVVVTPYPTVNAGADGSMCENQGQFQLSGYATDYSTIQWSIYPPEAGVISNTSSLYTMFTPSNNPPEIVTLRLTAFPLATCPNSSNYYDELTLTINSMPEVDAGVDALICEGDNYYVQGSAQDASSTLWTTSGSGYFSNSFSLNTTYNPSTNDYMAGQVTITLKANAESPCTGFEEDQMVLSFEPAPEADAGNDLDVCQGGSIQINASASNYSQLFWTTSGDGNFVSPNTTHPTYLPGDGDVNAGEVTLTLHAQGNTPCSEVTDNLILTVWSAPTADAGNDATTCEDTPYQLNGDATFYNSLLWTTSGDGTFDNATELNAEYMPGAVDIINGTVELSLRVTASDPCTDEVVDELELTVKNLPVVDAGNDVAICSNGVLDLSGEVEDYSSVEWTYDGDGQIANPNELQAAYTPGPNDILAGSVEITLTATAESPCSGSVSDILIVSFSDGPLANAGDDADGCENNPFYLGSAVAESFSFILWETSGDGVFDDETEMNPNYIPGEQDAELGTVTLTMTVSSSGCGDDIDQMTLSVTPAPVVEITSTENTLCGETVISLVAIAENYGSISWTNPTDSDGSFSDENSLSTSYTLGSDDIANGSVRLIIAANALIPCPDPARDTIMVYYFEAPVVDAGADETYCSADTISLSGSAENTESEYWFIIDGEGEIIENTGAEEAKYVPAPFEDGDVRLRLEGYSPGDCPAASDTVIFSVQGAPFADIQEDTIQICEDGAAEIVFEVQNTNNPSWGPGNVGDFITSISNTTIEFTPSDAHIADGEVMIILSAFAQAPCGEDDIARDTVIVVINRFPEIVLDEEVHCCAGDGAQLNAEVTGASAVNWSTDAGDGTFDDENSLTPVYIPGENDIAVGVIDLMLTATANHPCSGDVSEVIRLVVKPTGTLDIGEGGNVNFNSVIDLEPEIELSEGIVAQTIQWSPAEYVTSTETLNTSTVPLLEGMGDDGIVTIYLDIELSNGCMLSDSIKFGLELGDVTVNIDANPEFVCEGESVTLSAVVTGGSPSHYVYSWTSIPEGFTSVSASNIVTLEESMSYVVMVTDDVSTDYDTIHMDVQQKPVDVAIAGPSHVNYGSQKEYVATDHTNWTYDWDVINGDIISGQWSNTIIVQWDGYTFGEVRVVPTNEYGCQGDTTYYPVTMGGVGQNELLGVSSLNIYPNPFKEKVRVDYDLDQKANVSIEVYSLLGNVCYRMEFVGQEKGVHIHDVFASDLGRHSGVLFLKVTVNNQSTSRKLILLNK